MNLDKLHRSFFLFSTLSSAALVLPGFALANDQNYTASTETEFCLAPDAVLNGAEANVVTDHTDLEAIKLRGTLRVLLQRKSSACIISQTESRLLNEFAYLNDLELNWIYVDNDWELLPELLNGKGDMIVGQDIKLSANIHDQVQFTHHWANASIKIVERSDNSHITKVEDLAGRQLAAYKSSPVWPRLLELTETLTGFVLHEIPPTVPYREVMQRVKSGQYDLAVADSLFLDTYLPTNTELQASFSLSDQRNMAWAVRADAGELHSNLNQYLNQQHLTHNIDSVYFEDLSLLKSRGILRVITTANPAHYYLRKGKLQGFEYELLNKFAKKHQLRVDVVLAESQQEMFELLKQGKGDIVAASLPGEILANDDQIQFTQPYNYVSPIVVGRSDDKLLDLRALGGRRITLPQHSPYWNYLKGLQEQGLEFELVKADPGINTEGTLLMVAMGMFDLTVVGNHQIKATAIKGYGLKSQFNLAEPLPHRWAVRTDNQQLHHALNNYLVTQYRSAEYNVLQAKYFEKLPAINRDNKRKEKVTALSPYDDLTKHYADKHGFDWRLITALMFQESQFDPNAYSYAGAEGLMQLIPDTAALMGVSDTQNPETNINGGIRYLSYLRNKFEDDLLLEDRMWFTLASYNAGYGRVKRARQVAVEMGLDKDRWFGNVELAMLAMAKPFYKDGEQVRYCRCGQAVVYVREIRTRYYNYIRLMETQKLAALTVNGRRSESVRIN